MFLTNKLPSVREKLKIDVDDIRAHNPNIIYVRGTGQGDAGPDADKGCYDVLGFWCPAPACRCGDARPTHDVVPGMPAPGVRRLHRRDDHRRRHLGRAVPPRAHG